MKEFFENVYAMIYCGYTKCENEAAGIFNAPAIITIVYIIFPLMNMFGIYSIFVDSTYFVAISHYIPKSRTDGILLGIFTYGPIFYLIYRYYKPKRQILSQRWRAKENKQLRTTTRLWFYSWTIFQLVIFFLGALRKFWLPYFGIDPTF